MDHKTLDTGANNNTVSFELPPGMTQAEFIKAFSTFEKLKDKGVKIAKADGAALGRLKKAHAEEFLRIRIEEWKKVGLDTTHLKLVKA
jgi:acetoin utilization deacetylase AcuC-like enzyme